jgi:anti-sigma factor RsiW
MADRHWHDDEILARLYDVGPQNGHIEACYECRTRLEALQQRRESVRAREPEVPADLLAGQRRAIYERIERKPMLIRLRLAPSLAALLLVLVIVSMFRPAPQRQAMDPAADASVFEDVFKIATSTEPSAVEPVRSLFEEQQ